MRRPLMLDLYCCQGGAAHGYMLAGFAVHGVDKHGQPQYPYRFFRGDALTFLAKHGDLYDAVHASSPCQGHTQVSVKHRGKGTHADTHDVGLLAETQHALREWAGARGRPWANENVVGARPYMPNAVVVHGGMFGLRVYRPRLIESNVALVPPVAPPPRDALGVYGKLDGRRLWTRRDRSTQRAPRTLAEAQSAMGGCEWMTWEGLREAIPPAYTRWVGARLLAYLGTLEPEVAHAA